MPLGREFPSIENKWFQNEPLENNARCLVSVDRGFSSMDATHTQHVPGQVLGSLLPICWEQQHVGHFS